MNKLHELRTSRGMNMKQVASALGIPYTTYVNYEKGVRELNSEMLVSFAEFYNVSVDYLIGRTADPGISAAETNKRTIRKEDIMFALARGNEEVITDEMFEEIQNFANYLIQRESAKKEK